MQGENMELRLEYLIFYDNVISHIVYLVAGLKEKREKLVWLDFLQ